MKKGLISDVSLQPKIRNMVICVDFGKEVNLEDLSLEKRVIYEPEQFSGGIFRILEPHKASVLIFASGKAVITGLTAKSQIEITIERVKKLLNDII